MITMYIETIYEESDAKENLNQKKIIFKLKT